MAKDEAEWIQWCDDLRLISAHAWSGVWINDMEPYRDEFEEGLTPQEAFNRNHPADDDGEHPNPVEKGTA